MPEPFANNPNHKPWSIGDSADNWVEAGHGAAEAGGTSRKPTNVEAAYARRPIPHDREDPDPMATTEQAPQAGLHAATEAVMRATDRFIETLSVSGPEGQAFARSSQNLQILADCSTVMATGVQDIWREWIGATTAGMHMAFDGAAALASCRSVHEVATVQNKLLRDNIERVLDTSRRVARLSLCVTEEAVQRVSAPGVEP